MKKQNRIFSVLMVLAALLAGIPAQSAHAAENTGQSSSPLMTPNAWDALGSGLNGIVLAIAVNGTDIYAGGSFTDAGGDPNADYIAKWDGTSWSALSTGLNGIVRTIVVNGSDIYVGGDFTDAGGDSNADYVAKWNGTSWSTLGTGLNASVEVIAVSGSNVYVGGEFTDASGNANADYIAMLNGNSWDSLGTTPLNSNVYTVMVNGGEVYVGGVFFDAGGDANADRIAKWNGSSWSALGSGLNATVHAIVLHGGDVYAGGQFSNAGGNAAADYIARWNGTSWSDVGGGLNLSLRTIATHGTDLYVGGYFTDAGGDADADYIAKWDGTSWSALGTTPLSGAVNRIVINGLDLYAGGQFSNAGGDANADRIARFEIHTDTPTVDSFSATSPSTSLNIPVTAFTASDDDSVTGYKITESSTPPAAGDAGWSASAPTTYTVPGNGSYTLYPWAKDAAGNVSSVYGSPTSVTVIKAWNALGSGLNGTVLAIAIDGTDIYAGGSFTDAGGDPNADYIAKWDGASWSALGTGLNSFVRTIVINGEDIYVGGDFTDAGGDANADRIAKWNGASWSTLGTGLNASVHVIAVSGSNVYVGGAFTDASGNASADYIAKLDGDTWGGVGPTPLNGKVYTVVLNGGEVYAGGEFTDAGGDANADKIAKWNGSSWSALGGGLNNIVHAVVLHSGDVYVGGDFTDAGGNAAADYIVRWNGTSWSDVGGGLNLGVRTIVTNGTDIYAGGYFQDAGGDANADYIVKWDGTSWSTLSTTSLNNTVNRIVINGTDLYAGGQFTDASGDSNADRIARYEIDADAPTVDSFSATSPSNSLDIPITAFTASDNIVVTGYKITESSTPPAAGDSGWSASAPTTYTVASNGSYTLYPWAKDIAGNVSALYGSPASVSVDTTTPTITDVTSNSNTGCILDSGTYRCNASDTVNIQVTFSEAVSVTGTPQLALNSGGTASYSSGSGTSALTFNYTVASGENASDLDYTSANALTLNGGTIQDAGTNDATLTLPAPGNSGSLSANTNIIVDTTAPTVTSFTRETPSVEFTDADTLIFRATFSEQVMGVGVVDFDATGTTASISDVFIITPYGPFTVEVSGGDLAGYNGVVGLDFSGSMNITDRAGNPLANTEPSTDETYTVDNAAPTVDTFIVPSSASSLNIPITDFTASDAVGVTGYLITESDTPPNAGDSGWTASAPTTYTVTGIGDYILYPWAKDEIGHVSAVYGSPASVNVAIPLIVTNTNDSGAGSLRGILALASPGDTITFDAALSGETITLNSTLTLSIDVTIDGSTLASPVSISGMDNVRVFYVNTGVTAALDSLIITEGLVVDDNGAGIYNGGTLTITNSAFTDHTLSYGYGGAIFNDGALGGILTVANSTFSGNYLDGYGGAIANNNGTVTITNSTISDNWVSEKGGGIAQIFGGTMTIQNSTISGNTADFGGGIYIDNNAGTLNYANTIIANSISGGDCFIGSGATLGTNTNNLVEDGSCSASLSGDPNLGALADNGGSTQTFALLAGSPAIDAGDDTICANAPVNNESQNGILRPQGVHCDIGSFELDIAPTVVSIVRANANPTAAASVDFTVTFSEPVTGVDTSDFSLTTTGISVATVSGVSGSNDIYAVTVNTGSGNGTIRLDVVDDDTIEDLTSNKLGGAGAGNSDFTSGEVYTINKTLKKTFKSIATQDGWILESSETSGKGGSLNSTATVLYVGDNAQDKQYRSILSFNTIGLPDTNITITSVKLRIKIQGFTGGNMFTPTKTHGNLLVDISNPDFGTNANLAVSDFQATASLNNVGVMGSAPDTGWRTITLKSIAYDFINLDGKTQFRLRFQTDDNNDMANDFMKIFSGNAPAASRPQLIVEYSVP